LGSRSGFSLAVPHFLLIFFFSNRAPFGGIFLADAPPFQPRSFWGCPRPSRPRVFPFFQAPCFRDQGPHRVQKSFFTLLRGAPEGLIFPLGFFWFFSVRVRVLRFLPRRFPFRGFPLLVGGKHFGFRLFNRGPLLGPSVRIFFPAAPCPKVFTRRGFLSLAWLPGGFALVKSCLFPFFLVVRPLPPKTFNLPASLAFRFLGLLHMQQPLRTLLNWPFPRTVFNPPPHTEPVIDGAVFQLAQGQVCRLSPSVLPPFDPHFSHCVSLPWWEFHFQQGFRHLFGWTLGYFCLFSIVFPVPYSDL